MPASADTVRFGHAYLSDSGRDDEMAATREVLEVATGQRTLHPREAGSEAVKLAEAVLKANPRPIYAYLGNLHPALGKAGLIVERSWASTTRLQGLTYCDSGGIAARCAGFACLEEHDVETALHTLSTPAPCNGWPQIFRNEIDRAYDSDVLRYVRGDTPQLEALDDLRKRFVRHAEESNIEDRRRLWTWEFRFSGAPNQGEVVALVCTRNGLKELNDLRRQGHELPAGVTIFAGRHDSLQDAFSSERTRDLLGGEP